MGSAFLKFAIVIVATLVASHSFGHARLIAGPGVAPRSNNAGIKTGPCGGVARVAVPAQLKPGSKITVWWEETIQHPGRYEFYFSDGFDTNFKILAIVPDMQDDPASLPHQYSVDLDLPIYECTACTLQMIQVMTENPAAPRNYYSCADIILAAGAVNPPPTPPPPPPPPGLAPECH